MAVEKDSKTGNIIEQAMETRDGAMVISEDFAPLGGSQKDSRMRSALSGIGFTALSSGTSGGQQSQHTRSPQVHFQMCARLSAPQSCQACSPRSGLMVFPAQPSGRDRSYTPIEDSMHAAVAGAPKVPHTTEERMHALIALQSFDGSWSGADEVLETLGIEKGQLGSLFSDWRDIVPANGAVLATMTAVAWLVAMVKDEEDSWELIAEKARGWLRNVAGTECEDKIAALVAKIAAL